MESNHYSPLKNTYNMIKTITNEQEIADTYRRDMATEAGIVSLSMEDFEELASRYRPALAVTVDEPLSLAEMIGKGLETAKSHVPQPAGIILSIAYKPGNDLLMEELQGMSDALDKCCGDEVNILWGAKESAELENGRGVSLYVFGKKD